MKGSAMLPLKFSRPCVEHAVRCYIYIATSPWAAVAAGGVEGGIGDLQFAVALLCGLVYCLFYLAI